MNPRSAAITGWGCAVPDQVLTNAHLEQLVETNDEWITERTGIRERRIASANESTASLAIDAGAAAIKKAGLTPTDVGLFICATTTPETPIPHTGSWVGDGIGLSCGSFDLNAACAGFVYSLVVGTSLIQAGAAEHLLIIGSETLSRVTDPTDRGTCILFGDGAAAVVLSATDAPDVGLESFDLGCDGSAADILFVPSGGSRSPASPQTLDERDHFLKMNGQEVFRRAVRAIVDSATATMESGGFTADDIDWFIPHQANIRIIEAAANRLAIPMERAVLNLDRYGNTSAASIPLALTEAADEGRFQPGDRILLSGFGAGMTWASALVRWGNP